MARFASRRHAFYAYDWANSVFTNSVTSVFFGPLLTDVARDAADREGFVHPGGVAVRAESVYPATVALATVLLLPALLTAGWASRRVPRNRLLAVLVTVGSASTVALATVAPATIALGAVCFVLATVALSASVVVVNTCLPELADPGDRAAVSARASAAGYASGAIVLVVSFGIVAAPGVIGLSDTSAPRVCVALAGVWWLAFSVWPVRRLPATHASRTGTDADVDSPPGSLREVTRHLRRGSAILPFLVAFALYNNGYQGLSSQSSTYGSEELQISETGLIAGVLLVNVVAAVGALGAGRVARRVGTGTLLVGAIGILTTAVVLGGVIPAGSLPAFLGLAVLIDTAHGTLYPVARGAFAEMVPDSARGPLFAVFELVNRSLAAFGALAFAAVLQVSGSYRLALVPIGLFLVAGGAVLLATRQRVLQVRTVVPSFQALTRVQDKVSADRTLRSAGLTRPPSRVVHDPRALLDGVTGPVFVKSAIGTASTGVHRAETPSELSAVARLLERAGAFEQGVVVEEPVPGPLIMVQSVFDHGQLRAIHVAERVREGSGGGASHKTSRRLPEVTRDVSRLGSRLGWHGALSIDAIRTPDGPVWIDVNPRLVEPVNAARSGTDLVGLMLALACDEPAPASPVIGRPGVRTHQLLLALLGAAPTRGRAGVARELVSAARGRGSYAGSTEELTPLDGDLRSAVPLLAVSAMCLLRPRRVEALTRSSVGGYALTARGWRAICDGAAGS